MPPCQLTNLAFRRYAKPLSDSLAINPNQSPPCLPETPPFVRRCLNADTMIKLHTHTTPSPTVFVSPKATPFTRIRPTPKGSSLLNLQLHQQHSPSIIISSSSLKFCSTTTLDPHSFTVSYLVNNCGFSPETAFKASHKLTLYNSQKPDSVLTFFRTHGFSNSQIRDIVRRELWLLHCDPDKVVLPKFEFLLSKGASASEVVHMVSTSPRFLSRNLHNHIIPAYEFVRGFLQSDKGTLACINRNSCFLSDGRVAPNVKLLLDNGVTHSNIARLLRSWPSILCSCDLLKTVEELKELGFDSSTSAFSVALRAKRTVNKTKWAEKIDTFMRWGWSQEEILLAFKRQPYCMLSSTDKINAVMSFWVDQLGMNSSDLVKTPGIFLLSLEKRIIPRASVVQFLISKGLREKGASMYTPFVLSEKLFLEKFVICFEEDSSHLLKLYEQKMNPANSMEEPSPSV